MRDADAVDDAASARLRDGGDVEDQLERKWMIAAPPAEGDAVGGFAGVAAHVPQVPVARLGDLGNGKMDRVERRRFVLREGRYGPQSRRDAENPKKYLCDSASLRLVIHC